MNTTIQTQAHPLLLQSFYSAYPLTQQQNHQVNTTTTFHEYTIKTTGIPITYCDNFNSLIMEEDDDAISRQDQVDSDEEIDDSALDEHTTQESSYGHLHDYLAYLQQGPLIKDGTDGIEVGGIVAVQPSNVRAIPWFGKVVRLLPPSLEILWLHKAGNSTKYFYLDTRIDTIPLGSVICNGVEFEPTFGDKLMWKLLTPLPFIKSLNNDTVPPMESPLTTPSTHHSKRSFDISGLVFANKQEFENYLYNAT